MENMALGTDYAKELENYRKRCIESEEKSKMDEVRCMVLENEVEDLKKKNKELEEQIVRNQKAMSNEEKGKEKIVDLTDDGNESDGFLLLMENKALECEKVKAETEISVLKEKVKQLESQVCELESKLDIKVKNESNVVSTPKCDIKRLETGAKRGFCSQVRKRLSFGKDGCSDKKLAPSTPGLGFAPPPSSGVIDISDEDETYIHIPKVEEPSNSNFKNNLECTSLEHIDEDDKDGFTSAKGKRSSNLVASDDEGDMDGFTSAKRKRSANMVTSDDEDDMNDFERKRSSNIFTSDDDDDDDDDNAPICTLIKKDCEDGVTEDVSRRPLKRLRKSDDITIDPNKSGNSSSEDEEDDETLGGFIVESSESASESESGSGDTDGYAESEDGLNDYKGTLDKIRRKKDLNVKWDLEGEMLADFGKDTELCMRAVCALYRQQTADEKVAKWTIHQNGRGFSQIDANRASELAEFLTAGDSNGDLNKTVEELERYDTKGIEFCRALAAKYSKQLFQIYKNKEDPYFMP